MPRIRDTSVEVANILAAQQNKNNQHSSQCRRSKRRAIETRVPPLDPRLREGQDWTVDCLMRLIIAKVIRDCVPAMVLVVFFRDAGFALKLLRYTMYTMSYPTKLEPGGTKQKYLETLRAS